MKYFRSLLIFIYVVFLSVSFYSCAQEKTSSVLFQGINENKVLTAVSKEADPDSILLSKSKEVIYRLDSPIIIPHGYSLEITYSFSVPNTESYQEIESALADWEHISDVEISFDEKQDAWFLPVSLRTVGIHASETLSAVISYAVPLQTGSIDSFSIKVKNNDSFFSRGQIYLDFLSFKLIPQWFGLVQKDDQLTVTPFVYLDDTESFDIVTINPPEKFRLNHPELNISGFEAVPDSADASQKNYIKIGTWEYPAARGRQDLYAALEADQSYHIEVCGSRMSSIVVQSSENRAYPLQPIMLSPGEILSFDRNQWRRGNYEVFRWNQFPGILIFDTADYAVQDRLVKRLAFFVEKAGFEGRLSSDEEIAHLHGWNAHDYRAEDLARFFETARITAFPLNLEELELKEILLEQNIIVRNNDESIVPGNGAIVSISQESPEYQRYLFIVHECYHGLYFIDQDFEAFCRYRWKNLHPAAKRFISEYFASMRYDTQNEYLMANELMAYCLQQTVRAAGDYFGRTLAGRIYENPVRNHVLPEKDDDSAFWPLLAELFTEEAEAFSEYVNRRWGLRAGSLRINREQ